MNISINCTYVEKSGELGVGDSNAAEGGLNSVFVGGCSLGNHAAAEETLAPLPEGRSKGNIRVLKSVVSEAFQHLVLFIDDII